MGDPSDDDYKLRTLWEEREEARLAKNAPKSFFTDRNLLYLVLVAAAAGQGEAVIKILNMMVK